jgi:hygromycin-B 4-O-kinase
VAAIPRKPTLAPPAIRGWVQACLGAVGDLHQLAEGEESQAFGFQWRGQDHVVRVNRSAQGFAKDRLAFERFAGPALPIPEVVAVGQVDAGHAACITRRLPGITLQDCDAATLARLAGPVAEVLAAIGAADLRGTAGFGEFDHRGLGRHASWRAFLAAPLRYPWTAVGHRVERATVRTLLSALDRLGDACPERRRLVHGDFGSNNVLTDGERVTGVLDWGEALFGDPLFDVANLRYWAPWLECMRVQASWFAERLPADPDVQARLRCYQLRIGLQELYHHAAHGSDAWVDWHSRRTVALLDQVR